MLTSRGEETKSPNVAADGAKKRRQMATGATAEPPENADPVRVAPTCVFSIPLPDACVRACCDFFDVRAWFGFGAVSRFARDWCDRPSQTEFAVRGVLARAASSALRHELEELGIADVTRSVAADGSVRIVRHSDPKLAVAELEAVLARSRGAWSGGSLALGLCGGIDISGRSVFNDEQLEAWQTRDLDFFIPWRAAFGGLRLCPVAQFFDRHCPQTPLWPHDVGPADWRSVCRYMTKASGKYADRLHDSRGAYFTEPAEDHGAREWVPRPVLETPSTTGRPASLGKRADPASIDFPLLSIADIRGQSVRGGAALGRSVPPGRHSHERRPDTNRKDGDDEDDDDESFRLHGDATLDQVAEHAPLTKRNWRWSNFDSDRYCVPFSCARRLFRFPGTQRSVDLVYIDLDAFGAALATRLQRPMHTPDARFVAARPDIASWCRLAFDATILRNTYDGRRLTACAYTCLRSLSFEFDQNVPILELAGLPPEGSSDTARATRVGRGWGEHGRQTAKAEDDDWVDWRETRAIHRLEKYRQRGCTSRPAAFWYELQ